jgi:hypothetical protein
MDVKQKYIKGDEFELDEYFLKQIYEFEPKVRRMIISEIDKLYGLPHTNKQIVKISGVVHDENAKPTFFKIEYFRAKTSASILVDVYEIELDEYLDTISNNEIYIK